MRKIRRCRFHRWARSTGAPRRVYIWLGDVDADEVAIAFANIRMAQTLSAATESYKTVLCKSLTILTQKPWFTGRWVIQEVKLADRAVLHYGEHYIEYTRFRAAWYLVGRCLLSQGNLGYLRHLLRRNVTEDLLELLWGFHMAKYSDPRDCLAALYGFFPQSEQPIALHYDQVGWKEMYRRLAERSINKGTLSASRVILHLFAFGSAAGRSLDNRLGSLIGLGFDSRDWRRATSLWIAWTQQIAATSLGSTVPIRWAA